MCVWGDNSDDVDVLLVCSLLFIPFGVIVLALMTSCCSLVRQRLSRRLRMVSSGTTVTSASECLRLLKSSTTTDFSC